MLHLTWPLFFYLVLGVFSLPKHQSASCMGFLFCHSDHVAHCCIFVPVCVEYCLKQISCVMVCFGFSLFYHQFYALIYFKMWEIFFKNMKNMYNIFF